MCHLPSDVWVGSFQSILVQSVTFELLGFGPSVSSVCVCVCVCVCMCACV